jgi:putative SOS response-associated peptidase YedK
MVSIGLTTVRTHWRATMCSRYDLTTPPEAVLAYFGYRDTPNFPPRDRIRPTEPIAVVLLDAEGERRFRLMRWGLLPHFVKDPKTFPTLFNARSEELLSKPSFRNAARRRRCLIPADGFYEWTGPKGQRRPYYLRPEPPHLFAFAGLYESWSEPEGGVIDTATILTCEPNATVAPLHNRMPVILAPECYDAWLDTKDVSAEEALAMTGPAPDDLLEAIPLQAKGGTKPKAWTKGTGKDAKKKSSEPPSL